MPFDAGVVAAHAGAIGAQRWFERTGTPLADDELRALAPLAPHIARLESWDRARALADDPRANAAYDEDAREAAALRALADAAAGTEIVLRTLSALVDQGLAVFFSAAERALARAGRVDGELARVAAGAAAVAVYHGALAAAVAGPEHRLVRVEACYAAGRWPAARIGDTLYVL